MIGAISSIKIYNPVGSVYFSNVNRTSTDFPITDQCERSAKLMGDDYVRLQFKLYDKITFDAFSFIEYDNQTFFLREQYVPTPNGTKKEDGGVSSTYYTYDLKFVSVANMLDKHICYRYVKVGEHEWYEPEININGNISTMYVIVMGAIKRVAEQYRNTLYGHLLSTIYANGMAADGINPNTDNVRLTEGTKLLTFNFSGDSIANVCTTIANNYTNEDKKDTEWYITEEHGVTPELTKLTLHFAKCISNENEQTFGDYVRRGNNLHPYTSGGLKKVEYAQAWSGIAQTLVPFGSDRNMSGQSVKGIDEITNLQSTFGKRLRLDTHDKDGNPMKYKVHDLDGVEHEIEVDSRGGIRNEFVNTGIEKVVFFDEVYPQGHFRVEKVEIKNKRQDEETIPEYTITALPIDSNGNVIPKDALSPVQNGGNGYYPIRIEEGTTLSVRFESGMLAGREFEIANKSHKDYDAPTYSMKFTIVADGSIEDGTLIPSGNFRPYGDLSTSTAEKAPSGKGDTFALFNMKMPNVYIEQAKQELAQKAYEELLKIQTTRPEVKCTTDPTNFNGAIAFGNVINAQSELFNAEGYTFKSRVISYSYKLTKTTDVQFSLASAVMQGTLSSMNDMIADVTHTAGGLEQRAVNLSRRAWRDASEMADMLNSLRTEMMLVGEEKYQFAFTSAIECKHNTANKFVGLEIGYGSLQHTQEPYISYANSGWWEISGQTLTQDQNKQLLDGAKAYYLYAKVANTTGVPAEMVLSENAYSTNVDTDTEYLLLGILSSEYEGVRVFNRTNGFSSIAGGTITTEQIQDANRNLIIDFQSNPPRIIARNQAEIIGNIKFTEGGKSVQEIINDIEVGEIEGIGGENLLPQSMYHMQYRTYQSLRLTQLMPLEAGKTYVCTYGKFEDNATSAEEWARGVCLVVGQQESVEAIESVHQFGKPIEVNGNGRYLYIAWGVYDYVDSIKGTTPAEYATRDFTQYLDYVMVQEGSLATSFQPYVQHLVNAIKGSTEISGGLLMTNVLSLKNESNEVVAGMSGMSDNVLMWGGGSYQDAVEAVESEDYTNNAGKPITSLLKKDGQGKLGVFRINKDQVKVVTPNGNVIIDDTDGLGCYIANQGIPVVQITPNELPELNAMEGNTISRSFECILYTENAHERDDSPSVSNFNVLTYKHETSPTYFGNNTKLTIYGGVDAVVNSTFHANVWSEQDADENGTPNLTGMIVEILKDGEVLHSGVVNSASRNNLSFTIDTAGEYVVRYQGKAYCEKTDTESAANVKFTGRINVNYEYTESYKQTMLAYKGMYSYQADDAYLYYKDGVGFDCRMGQYRFKVSREGIQIDGLPEVGKDDISILPSGSLYNDGDYVKIKSE